MSYLVCHVEKFKVSDVRGMQIHNQRESENSKNFDIDHEKTNLNYDLQNGKSINYNHKVKEIIKDGYKSTRAVRKDAVVMTSTLITSDSEFLSKMSLMQQKHFFESSLDKLKELYGAENIVSAVVHMDEKTPHMHVCSVPLIDGKLSAKTIFDRKGLRNLQEELPKHLQNKGFDVKRGEKADSNKHIGTYEYKKNKVKELTNRVDRIQEDLSREYETLDSQYKAVETVKSCLSDIDMIEGKKSLIGGNITIKANDFNKLKDLALKGIHNADRNAKLEREKKDIEKGRKYYSDESQDQRNTISKQNSRIKNLEKQEKALIKVVKEHRLIDEVKKVLQDMVIPKQRNINREIDR